LNTLDRSSRRVRPQRRGRRNVIRRVALMVVGLALAFLLGIAFARTLDERPESGGAETIVRTLTPIPQGAPTSTVTVTVTTTP
jgi:hypothetical protein